MPKAFTEVLFGDAAIIVGSAAVRANGAEREIIKPSIFIFTDIGNI
jgi:hypothetical protein